MDTEALLHNPTFWVGIAFVCFVGLTYKKISRMGAAALDQRTARIKSELEEAQRLREEAAALLADYKRKQTEYLKEAEGILANAQKDADALRAYSEKELKNAVEARMKNAIERIAQEETKAINDVRNHVVDVALAAARALIVDHVGSLSQDELVTLALADIEQKIH